MNRLYFKTIIATGISLFITAAAFASKVWTGAQNSNWSNGANWMPSGVPSSSDAVIFSPDVSNASCTLPFLGSVKDITILPGYLGTISGFNSSLALFTVNGTFLQQGGNVDLRKSRFRSLQNLIVEGGSFSKGSQGNIMLTGFQLLGGTSQFSGARVDVMGNMLVTGGNHSLGSGTFEINGVFIQHAGVLSKSSGFIRFKNQIAPSFLGGEQEWNASVFIANGLNIAMSNFEGGNAALYLNGDVTINTSQFNQNGGSFSIPQPYSFSVNQSTLSYGQVVFNCGPFDAIESTIDLGTGNTTATGDVTFNTCIIQKQTGELRLAHTGILSLIASNLNLAGELFICKNLIMQDAYLKPNNNQVWISNALLENSSSIEKNTGYFECGYNEMIITNESSLYLDGCEEINLGSLQSNSSLFSFGDSPCFVNGSVILSNGSVFSAPTSTLTIKGNFETSGSSFDANNGEVIFNGSTSTGIHISGNPDFYTVSLNHLSGENEFRIDLIGSVGVLNTLKLNNGLSAAKPICLYGGSLQLSGNVDMSLYRSSLIPEGDGQISFTGSGNQQIIGNAASGNAGILPHLHIAKTGGIFDISDNLALGNGFSQSSGVVFVHESAHFFLHNGNFNLAGISAPRVTVSGSVTLINSLRVEDELSIALSGNLQLESGASLLVDNTFNNAGTYRNLSGTLVVNGELINSGTFEVNSGSFTANAGIQQLNGAFSCNTGNVFIAPSMDVAGGIFNAVAASVNLSGNLNQSGGEVWGSLDGSVFSISGDYNQTSGLYKEQSGILQLGGQLAINGTFERNSGSVQFNGTAPQTIPALAYHRVAVSGSPRQITLAPGMLRISATVNGLALPTNCTYLKTNNTIQYDGIGNQEIAGFAYENLGLSRGGTKTLLASASVRDVLQLGSATAFDADGALNNRILTLISSADKTARIAPIPTSASITGNVTIQRYTRGGLRSNRFIGSPVDTTGGVKIKQLKDDILLYGPGGASNGFNNASLFTTNHWVYDENLPNGNEWRSPASINEVLPKGKGLLLFHCGTPNQAPINASTVPNAATVDFIGTPNQGTIALPIQCTGVCVDADNGNGWNLLANPYASPIDWMSADWTRSGVSGTLYIWNPALNQYASFNLNNPAAATNGGSRYIAPSQGFFLKATSTNPVLVINESVKASQFADSTLFRLAEPQEQLRLKVFNADESSGDEVLVQFHSAASESFEEELDALKPSLPDVEINFAAKNELGEKFAAHVFNKPDLSVSDKLIPLELIAKNGFYTLVPEQLSTFDSKLHFILEDALTGNTYELAEKQAIAIEITSEEASRASNRFTLRITENLNNTVTHSPISIFPNPAGGDFVKLVTGSKIAGTIQIFSLCGQLMGSISAAAAENGIQHIDIGNLAAGMYSVVWQDGNIREVAKFVKQ
ncbi:MAG: T9SS type A sorting domain-containing protein [Bacteroidia bacterium]